MSERSTNLDFPATAIGRLGRGAFSATLSMQDFAFCDSMGLEPLDLVEGYCVMTKRAPLYSGRPLGVPAPYAARGTRLPSALDTAYTKTYRCPHRTFGLRGDHPAFGRNAEQVFLSTSWRRGFDLAYRRMVAQAQHAGAHGVIGIVDGQQPFGDLPATEFRIVGTAVRITDAPIPTGRPWTTYLAGQRLAKVIEMGFMPVSVVVQRTWIAVWASCMTAYLMEGANIRRGPYDESVLEAEQVSDARMAATRIATRRLKEQLGSDSLFGVTVETTEEELHSGNRLFGTALSGTRLRRFAKPSEVDAPTPVMWLR
jgi:hypothetical protein